MAGAKEYWFEVENPAGVDLDAPGVFEWRIENTGTYIATAKKTTIRKRLDNYAKRFRQLESGAPYKTDDPDGFRKIHRQVVEARKQGLSVTFAAIENCPPDQVELRRSYWVGVRHPLNL